MAGSLAEYDALEDCTRNIFGRGGCGHFLGDSHAAIPWL